VDPCRTEPWGTPVRQGVRREDDVSTEMYCERLDDVSSEI